MASEVSRREIELKKEAFELWLDEEREKEAQREELRALSERVDNLEVVPWSDLLRLADEDIHSLKAQLAEMQERLTILEKA